MPEYNWLTGNGRVVGWLSLGSILNEDILFGASVVITEDLVVNRFLADSEEGLVGRITFP